MSMSESEQSTTTDFQLHVVRENKNIVDYTEQKLKRYSKLAKDPQQQKAIQDLMEKYMNGSIAICWQNGLPAWLVVK